MLYLWILKLIAKFRFGASSHFIENTIFSHSTKTADSLANKEQYEEIANRAASNFNSNILYLSCFPRLAYYNFKN